MAKAESGASSSQPQPSDSRRARTTRATQTLGKAGVPYALHAYRHDPRVKEYGREAADELGFDPRRVFKTLLAKVDGELVVAVVPVSGTLDLKALAATVGGKRAEMADSATAERVTGYNVGGISPLGQRTKLPVIVDASAMEYESVLVSAGRRGLDLEIMPDLLIVTLNARTAPIYRED
jgi:Cys-tRNA(Pro)/Cys-tRNA(Cys) deacylase